MRLDWMSVWTGISFIWQESLAIFYQSCRGSGRYRICIRLLLRCQAHGRRKRWDWRGRWVEIRLLPWSHNISWSILLSLRHLLGRLTNQCLFSDRLLSYALIEAIIIIIRKWLFIFKLLQVLILLWTYDFNTSTNRSHSRQTRTSCIWHAKLAPIRLSRIKLATNDTSLWWRELYHFLRLR